MIDVMPRVRKHPAPGSADPTVSVHPGVSARAAAPDTLRFGETLGWMGQTVWWWVPNLWHAVTNHERDETRSRRMTAWRARRGAERTADPVAAPGRGGEPGELGELLRRSGRGDQVAFGQLYDELAPLVHGVVQRVVRDPAQSDEVTQEVFVELWRLAARYDETKGSVRSWAVTVAHRRAIDRVRSEQKARERAAREVANVTPDHDDVTDRVESEIQVDLDRVRVRRALGNLTALQREAVELAYFGGHTYREVAVLLGVAEGTVKSRIRDGMIRLRDELEAR
jgi:RNA polymerase sigma-70 factor (ECF subfamily)